MRNLLFILLLFTTFGLKAQQTYSINGIVNDDKGQPLPGATVFLTNTKIATSSDVSGHFVLSQLPAGPYELAVNLLGFEPYVQLVKIENTPLTINIKLKESSIELNAVVINGKPDPHRKEYLQLFMDNFIGKSLNAKQCKIVNPEAIRFHNNKKNNTLEASANDLLVIENEALGYRVKYLLKRFEYNNKYEACNYVGYPYFEEMKGTDDQQKQWKESRMHTYLGSSRHFFRAIMNHTGFEEGFAVYLHKKEWSHSQIQYQQFDSLFRTVGDTKKMITKSITGVKGKDTTRLELAVFFKSTKQPAVFYHYGNPGSIPVNSPVGQQSFMHVFADTIVIDKELLLNPTRELGFSGHWSYLRAADLLPLDYTYDAADEKKNIATN